MKLLLKKIGVYFFPIVVLSIALGLGIAAGYVSVSGMAKTFPGAGITMIILMSLIEAGKFVATTWIHRQTAEESVKGFFNKLKQKSLSIVMSIMVVVVMAITSFGIYGFLSHGYMATANQLSKSNKEIELLDKKIESKNESITNFEGAKETSTVRITTLNEQRGALEVRLDSLYARRWWSSVNATRKQIDESNAEIIRLTKSVSKSDSTIQVIRDEITKLEVEKIEVSNGSAVGEVGPLLYLSNVTGINMDLIVNYLIMVIMLVFDPFAIVLLLAANRSFDRIKARIEIEAFNDTIEPNPLSDEIENLEEVELFPNENKVDLDMNGENKVEPEPEEIGNVVYSGLGEDGDVKEKVKEFFEKKEERNKEFTEKLNELKSGSEKEVIDFSNDKESIYLNFLEFVFNKGELSAGDQIPSFQELKTKLQEAKVDYSEKDLQDFFLICNLLKIIKTDKNKRTVLKDYSVAKALVSNI